MKVEVIEVEDSAPKPKTVLIDGKEYDVSNLERNGYFIEDERLIDDDC